MTGNRRINTSKTLQHGIETGRQQAEHMLFLLGKCAQQASDARQAMVRIPDQDNVSDEVPHVLDGAAQCPRIHAARLVEPIITKALSCIAYRMGRRHKHVRSQTDFLA